MKTGNDGLTPSPGACHLYVGWKVSHHHCRGGTSLHSCQSWSLTLFFLSLAQNNKENKEKEHNSKPTVAWVPLWRSTTRSSKGLGEAWHSKGNHRTWILSQNGSWASPIWEPIPGSTAWSERGWGGGQALAWLGQPGVLGSKGDSPGGVSMSFLAWLVPQPLSPKETQRRYISY